MSPTSYLLLYLNIKKIFRDNISADEEVKILSAYNVLKLTSDDLIDIGNGKYKVQLSKKDIKKYSYSETRSFGTIYHLTKPWNLCTFTFENISENTYSSININNRFSYDGYKETPEQKALLWFTEDSSLQEDFGLRYDDFKPGDKKTFTFKIRFSSSGLSKNDKFFKSKCCDEDGRYIPHRITNLKVYEVFEDKEFLDVFNKAVELPMIEFQGRKTETDDYKIFSTKIYLELVD